MKQRITTRFLISLSALIIMLLSTVEASAQLAVGPNVNISQLAGNHQEAVIAINPTDPDNLFAFSNDELGAGMFAAFSTDGGATWTYVDPTDGVIADGDAGDPLPTACCDPSVAFDSFGNLFIAYLDDDFVGGPHIQVALSTDGGVSFALIATLGTLGVNKDQETIVTGPGSVWVTYLESGVGIVAHGAAVTDLGVVGAFGAAQIAPGSYGGNFGDIVIGPAGQVLVTYQIPRVGEGPAKIFVNLDADGLGAGGFGPAIAATTTNVGGFDSITPQPDRSVDAEAGLAYDRSGGPNNGRVYLVYTEETVNESNDTNILVRFSDDDGTIWSDPVQVNDDATTNSQFLPRIALDQTTGNIAVSWHDARNDDGLGGRVIPTASPTATLSSLPQSVRTVASRSYPTYKSVREPPTRMGQNRPVPASRIWTMATIRDWISSTVNCTPCGLITLTARVTTLTAHYRDLTSTPHRSPSGRRRSPAPVRGAMT